MSKLIYAADLFCGAGGTSTGLGLAAERLGLNLNLVAVNHWDRAVETHSLNHPWAKHYCNGLDELKPSKAVPGGRLDLLVASPECTHHSITHPSQRGHHDRSSPIRLFGNGILLFWQDGSDSR